MIHLGVQSKTKIGNSGQANMEYMLLMTLMFSLVGAAVKITYANLDESLKGFGGKFEKSLKTGRASVGAWSAN